MSKDKGILFKGEMVRAILEGRKTQTRRACSVKKVEDITTDWTRIQVYKAGISACITAQDSDGRDYTESIMVPWKVGDILYVRETWGVGTRPDPFQGWVDGVEYRADEEYLGEHDNLGIYPYEDFDYEKYQGRGWMPSLFMPKKIARIWLKVTNVRVERLLDISDSDAIAEGIKSHKGVPGDQPSDTLYYHYLKDKWGPSPVHSYLTLWDSINGAGSHKDNPWVWVVEFERVEKPD